MNCGRLAKNRQRGALNRQPLTKNSRSHFFDRKEAAKNGSGSGSELSERHCQLRATPEEFKRVHLRSTKSADEFLAKDPELAAVLLRSMTSTDEFKKRSRRFKTRGQGFQNSLSRVSRVRHESSARDGRCQPCFFDLSREAGSSPTTTARMV